MNYIYGLLDDSTQFTIISSLVLPSIYTSSEPLYISFFLLFKDYIDSILLFNIYIVLNFILNIFFSYKFFSLFSNSRFAKILVSILFSFSPYFLVKSQVHINLIPVWGLVLYITYIIKNHLKFEINSKKFIILGFFLSFLILLSNYLGYMGILFTFSYFFYCLIGFKDDKSLIKNYVVNILIFCSVVLICLTLVNFNYIKANYFLKFSGSEVKVEEKKFLLNRDLDDFLLFSAKPIHYILPPLDNPFFGFITDKYNKFLSDTLNQTNSQIFSIYIYNEHSSIFLGWLNILFAYLGYKKILKKNLIKQDLKSSYYLILFILIIFFVFSLPPYFIFFDTNIYLPSYISYILFPMFRSIGRLSIVVLLLVLVFVLKYFDFLLEKNNLKIKITIFSFFIFSFLEFFIPINLSYIKETPDLFLYAKKNLPENSTYYSYPFIKNSPTFFWSKEFKGKEFDYLYYVELFYNSQNYPILSDKMIKDCNNLSRIKKLDYIFVYESFISSEDLKFLNSNFELIYDSKKSNNSYVTDYGFFRILNEGNSYSNNGKIYKFDKNVKCKN